MPRVRRTASQIFDSKAFYYFVEILRLMRLPAGPPSQRGFRTQPAPAKREISLSSLDTVIVRIADEFIALMHENFPAHGIPNPIIKGTIEPGPRGSQTVQMTIGSEGPWAELTLTLSRSGRNVQYVQFVCQGRYSIAGYSRNIALSGVADPYGVKFSSQSIPMAQAPA